VDFELSIQNSIDWLDSNTDRIDTLAGNCYWPNPYFSSAWLKAWWKRAEGLKKPVLLIVENEKGELLGFWPFVERKGILKSKGLWPYIFDEANYFHPIAEWDAIPYLIDGLQGLLKKYTFAWIPLMRKKFWEEFVETKVRGEKLLKITRTPRQTFLIDHTPQNFEDFWSQKMGAKSRKSFRYDQRALADQGEVEFECWETFEDVRAMMPATCVVEVESRKAKEGAGLYTVRGKRAFFFELLPELAKTGKVRLTILRLKEEAIAWQLDLLGENYVAVHHLSFDEKWKKYSPGRQLLRHNLEMAWNEGRTIDFLPLAFEYKEKLATVKEEVRELHWFKRSIRGWIACRLIRWNMKVRKKIKERKNHTPNPDNPVSKALRGETI
jgi:CelD/BcsL family acetyltransferase involved in cellulose biosynthesis